MIKKIKIADAQTDLPSLVKSVTEDNKIYAIENKEDSVILISQKNYESLQETIELLSIPDLRESLQLSLQQINENETYSFEEVLGDID
ncbi:MAG: type II toxin-antitoxin system Phd/YefM family antitoxin [Microcystis sp.]|jgi:antitoxin YefM|uniref:type II toxin-antitoxin system Phd/YefM family antitoxin n=1 Tax=Microcystis sp. TaxID=1127 RepID=UPI00391887BD